MGYLENAKPALSDCSENHLKLFKTRKSLDKVMDVVHQLGLLSPSLSPGCPSSSAQEGDGSWGKAAGPCPSWL